MARKYRAKRMDNGEWTDSKGRVHQTSDSARYKALGNSIALPPWRFVLGRLNAYLTEHTMASLFDGIGGIPVDLAGTERVREVPVGKRDRGIPDCCDEKEV